MRDAAPDDIVALTKRAVDCMNAMQFEEARALLERVTAMEPASPSLDDSAALAASWYCKGLVLDRLGQHAAAFAAHRQCVERYGATLRPEERDPVERVWVSGVIERALAADPTLLARLPPAHHAFGLPTNIAQAGAIWAELAGQPDLRQQYLATLTELVQDDDARAGREHRRAQAVLERHFHEGGPFGLYLRNFDIEGSEQRLSDGTLMTVTRPGGGAVERVLAPAGAGHLPWVGLINAVHALRPEAEGGVPKLEVANAIWQTVLALLARRAARIVFDFRSATAGVVTELDIVLAEGRTAASVVVVPDRAMRSEVRTRWPAFTRVLLEREATAERMLDG